MLARASDRRLAEIRRRRGFSQVQVAARMGMGKSRVSQIESARVSTRDVLGRYGKLQFPIARIIIISGIRFAISEFGMYIRRRHPDENGCSRLAVRVVNGT
jgi:transcriptional regulator with XRE-family HTH domain